MNLSSASWALSLPSLDAAARSRKHKIKNNNNNQNSYKKLKLKKNNFPVFKEFRKTMYNNSSSSNFFLDNNKFEKSSININRTSSVNLFQRKRIYKNNNNKNNSLNNINQIPKSNSTKTVNFEKMLSREYLNKQGKEKEPLHPQVNPKYDLVQPKCIMKVVYSNKTYYPKKVKVFQGLGEDVTFDADKLFYKYNNHFPVKSFYLDKMTGRANNDDNFPSYMVNLGNRNSCIDFTDKSYKMNNYSEGHLKNQISSFNQHKSFNWKLNMNMLNLNEIKKIREENNEINKIYKKIKGTNSMKNIRGKKIDIPGNRFLAITLKKSACSILPEYYRINLDKIAENKEFYKNKIDGITLKTYKKTNNAKTLLNEKEKELFLMNITSY